MTCNVGGVERVIRICVGMGVLALGAFAGLSTTWTGVVYALGTILVVTGAVGFCPAWELLGINTCPNRPSAQLRNRPNP
jgi:hypothetical protein